MFGVTSEATYFYHVRRTVQALNLSSTWLYNVFFLLHVLTISALSNMLHLEDFTAWVSLNGVAAETYVVERPASNSATCWIASEAGTVQHFEPLLTEGSPHLLTEIFCKLEQQDSKHRNTGCCIHRWRRMRQPYNA